MQSSSSAPCSNEANGIWRLVLFIKIFRKPRLHFLKISSSQFVPCFIPYSKEDYSYIALPLTKAGAVTILMEYTRAPKGIEQMLVTQSHSNSMRRSYFPISGFCFVFSSKYGDHCFWSKTRNELYHEFCQTKRVLVWIVINLFN